MEPFRKRLRQWLTLIGLSTVLLLAGCSREQYVVLDPKGPVAKQQYDLIVWSFGLMLIIVLAVFGIFAYVIIKYRAKPENKGYEPPDQEGSKLLETVWTLIPIVVVIALAVPTVKATYGLEKQPSSDKPPITIKVTSADWKWIFRYPKEGIETVNYVTIPADTPVNFEMDAVGPMNSFWVPSLGGQEYTMPGMVMHLWLQADQPGVYQGRSANFSGKYFTHMTFDVIAKSPADYDKWVQQVKKTAPKQTEEQYLQLLERGLAKKMTFSSYPKIADQAGLIGEVKGIRDKMNGPKEPGTGTMHHHHHAH
jgi:cytochrome aa3-600 menaquinol oxidase subunit II